MKETSFDWLQAACAKPSESVQQAASARQAVLTKPHGALGQLETLAIRLASLQHREQPSIDAVHICVFVGDHGVATEGVSAFPQAVTAEMVRNFARGGAAISVAAQALGAHLEVVNLGTVQPVEPLAGVIDARLGPGTGNFVQAAAMTATQLAQALILGRDAAHRAQQRQAQLFIGGEMGIGNTTSATAIACALLDEKPNALVGPGTGLDNEGIAHKAKIIGRALDLHLSASDTPIETLRRLGGFEIAALVGSYIACGQLGLPVLVDGFISSVAALVALRMQPDLQAWLLYSHCSAEPGHRKILAALKAVPLLDIGMRLGEGSGAAIAVPLLRMACALHNGMATFAQAEVSGKL